MFTKTKSELSIERKNAGHTRFQWLVVIMVSTNMLAYGLETGWISPTTKILQSESSPTGYPLSDEEVSWLGSVMALVAVAGVSVYAYLADAYGRKMAVLAVAVPQVFSWAIKLKATSFTMLMVSRVMAGLPAGGCFNALPMYVREISQDDIRGAVVSTCLMMMNFGLLFMYTMGSYLDYHTVLWISLCVPLLATVSMFFAPESPAFLVKNGKYDEAAHTVAILRGLSVDDKVVQNEISTMKNNEMYFKSLPNVTFANIFKNKAWRKGFILIVLIVSAQASNGVYSIMMFAWSILSSTGVSMNPDLQTLVVPVLLIFGSLVSIVCMERLGRKLLLIITFTLTAVAMSTMGVVLLLQKYGIPAPSWISMVAIATCVWSYSAGVTPAFYVVMSEMFNFQVRSKLIGCVVSYGWFASSLQLVAFAPISDLFGIQTMFFIFAIINLFGGVVSLVLLPETKGKSAEEIEDILGR